MRSIVALLLVLCISCEKYYLNVKRERVDRNSLASTFVGSPDPEQAHPPIGQRLIVEWNLPRYALKEEPILSLQLIFRNYTTEDLTYTIESRHGYFVYNLLDREFFEKEGLLTYKAEITDRAGTLLNEWQQQMWVELIKIEE